MKNIRVAIVGLGRLGFKHTENITYNIKNVELKAVCSINKEELVKAKKELKTTNCFTSFSKMISDIDLDAIVIVSSSNYHCKHVILALKKGLHVFCEKPLGVSTKATLIAELATQSFKSNELIKI